QKKRKRIVKVKQEKVVEEKTSSNTSASGAEVPEAKSIEDKIATETAATEVVGTSGDKGKAVKKPRIVKKRAARIQRKNVVSDSEKTEEEEPMFKRKITKPVQKEANPEKAQPASENM
ncbi:hypothetical protein A2U01_0055597, partial [Trifolium medium]|nr:hypothetical protein [Trifolium medium]